MNSDSRQSTPGAPAVAYFSMEIALEPGLPTYSGGLGMLAGDTIRAAADLDVPMVAVSLVHRHGYFRQQIDAAGWQSEASQPWDPADRCRELDPHVTVEIEGRRVSLRAWRYEVTGIHGHVVPVLLLDADLPENSEWDRTLTNDLYGGDFHYRLCQEIILGTGGVRLLRALGHTRLERFHMNEGHAAVLALELLDERAARRDNGAFDEEDIRAVKRRCVFTTHTPVPAGHDRFPLDHVARVLGREDVFNRHEVFCCQGELNMTYLALNLSQYVNGVAKRHGEVSREILTPRDEHHHYEIDSITNGVHLATWAAPSLAKLFDRRTPGWREDNSNLRAALRIPLEDLWSAHQAAKSRMLAEVNEVSGAAFDEGVFTIGFARRAATYKRADLLFSDPERLRAVATRAGRLQLVFAGKAHPGDEPGKRIIQRIFQARESLRPEIEVVFLADYDWELGRRLTSGVDLWLNTPRPPMEASGTSGMKAALNGVPSLSVLDGWWHEGCIEDVTGWAIGGPEPAGPTAEDQDARDARSLYDKLEHVILPAYYGSREDFQRVMRQAIALNASHFNTQRMMREYVTKAYFHAAAAADASVAGPECCRA